MVLVLGQDAGVLPTIVRGSSGTALGIDLVCGCVCGHVGDDRQSCGHFRGSNWDALIHSRSFVGSGSGSGGGGCDDMRRRYGATICTTDMHRRYARHENRKGQEQYALGPDIVCDSLLYFCWSIHLIIFPISVGTMRARNSSN